MKSSQSIFNQTRNSDLISNPASSDDTAQAHLAIIQQSRLAVTHELCTAVLAASALENTAILAAQAALFTQVAPWGHESYERIIRAYADSAIRHIKNF